MIRSVDEREREKQTMCTGINWNYELQDILEIAEVELIIFINDGMNISILLVYWTFFTGLFM